MFSANDEDKNFNLDKKEIRNMFKVQLNTELTDSELDNIFLVLDKDGDGTVSFGEWVSVLFPENQV